MADSSVKHWRNLSISNLSYQCMYQVWLKSLDIYSSYRPETKISICLGQITPSKFDKICQLAIPVQISTISIHKPSDVYSLSSGNENMGMSRADNSVKTWRNLPVSNPKPDLHNINAHTNFGENPFMFTQVIIRNEKRTGRRTTDGQMDRHTDFQCETIIPRHYCVAGYKKWKKFIKNNGRITPKLHAHLQTM